MTASELHERNQRLQEAYEVLAASSKSRSCLSSQPSSGSPAVSKSSIRRATTAFGENKTKRSLKIYGTKRSQDDNRLLSSSSARESQSSSKRDLTFSSAVEEIRQTASRYDNCELGLHSDTSSNERMDRDGIAASRDNFYDKSTRSKSIDSSESPQTSKSLKSVMVQQADSVEAPIFPDTTSESYGFNYFDPRVSLDDYSKRMLDMIELSPSGEAAETPGQSGTSQTGPRPDYVLPDLKLGERIPPISSTSMSSPSKECITINPRRVQLSKNDSCMETHDELSLFVTSDPGKNQPKDMKSSIRYGASRDEINVSSGSPSEAQSHSSHAQPSRTSTSTRVHFEISSDDADIGIPKEQYQPRPSRSRSGRGGDDVITPTDFSKRPETLVKSKKSKRRKTTAFERKKEKVEDEDWQAEGLLTSAIKPMKDGENNVTLSTLEESIEAEEEGLDENVRVESRSKPTTLGQKKSRGRPKKQPVNEEPDEHAREEMNIPDEKELPNPIENVKRASSPATNKRGGKRKAADKPEQNNSVEMNDSDQEEIFLHPPDSVQDAPAPAPTKRGRKRKIAEEPEQEVAPAETIAFDPKEPDNPSDNPTSATSGHGRKHQRLNYTDTAPLVPNDNNQTIDLAKPAPLPPPSTTEPHPPIVAVQQPLEEISANTLPSSPIKSASAVAPQTPLQAETTAQKGPDKHSPLNSGKMAYRVGLSRRQRIPPLLRIVRK